MYKKLLKIFSSIILKINWNYVEWDHCVIVWKDINSILRAVHSTISYSTKLQNFGPFYRPFPYVWILKKYTFDPNLKIAFDVKLEFF
jgi:hypothetical protein